MSTLERAKQFVEDKIVSIQQGYELTLLIETESKNKHDVLSMIYLNFPELFEICKEPGEAAVVIRYIGLHDPRTLNFAPLDNVLSAGKLLELKLAACNTSGNVIDHSNTISIAEEVIELQAIRSKIISKIQDLTRISAPNLVSLIGLKQATELIACVGGLKELVKIPSGNLESIGGRKKGLVSESDFVLQYAEEFRKSAVRLLSSKISLAARADLFNALNGETGKSLLDAITSKMQKMTAPRIFKQERPLPLPIVAASKKRGGKRARARKEKFGMGKIKKMQNRVAFGGCENEIIMGEDVAGMGTIVTNLKDKKSMTKEVSGTMTSVVIDKTSSSFTVHSNKTPAPSKYF